MLMFTSVVVDYRRRVGTLDVFVVIYLIIVIFAATKDIFDQRLDAFGGFTRKLAEVFEGVFSS